MKILVADDDSTSRLIARMALQRLGHECDMVTDGTQAWNAFQAGHHDVVLTDWLMPGQTGLQLCQNIRADTFGRHTYVILLTNRGAQAQILEGMNAGADDYLIKPLHPDELEGRMIAANRVTALHQQLAQQRIQLESLNDRLTILARRDPLTGLNNRRVLEEDLELLEARVTRYAQRYCIALLDIDHFKAYNDTYGHQAGDQALQAVSSNSKSRPAPATPSTATAARSSSGSSPSRRSSVPPTLLNACGPASRASISATWAVPRA